MHMMKQMKQKQKQKQMKQQKRTDNLQETVRKAVQVAYRIHTAEPGVNVGHLRDIGNELDERAIRLGMKCGMEPETIIGMIVEAARPPSVPRHTWETGASVWTEWSSLDDDCRSPVKTIARRLGMAPADVSSII
jgi:hypothetical protein